MLQEQPTKASNSDAIKKIMGLKYRGLIEHIHRILSAMARVSGTREKSLALIALGAVIRHKRKDLGLSQEELADESFIDRSHMGKIERGERNVTVLNILRIAKALKCEASRLFSEADL